MRSPAAFSTMPVVEEKPGGGLRNTIYEQQTRSGRRLTRGRLFLYKILVPVGVSLLRLVWRWSRIIQVTGAEHIAAALERAPSFIPVYWHQHTLFCVKQLLRERRAGLKLGFLISPSVDGEIGAMIVRNLGGEVIRGSSSHTGARALRDYYQALAHEGVSPAAQLSGRPMIPLSYAASHAWKIKWDRFVIPWPLSRIVIAVGEPVYVAKGLNADGLARLQSDMEHRLAALFEEAQSALG